MSGTTDLRRDPEYWCKVHRRYLPYGQSTCLLCELERSDVADAYAAQAASRRKRLLAFFPNGKVKRLLPAKPDRF